MVLYDISYNVARTINVVDINADISNNEFLGGYDDFDTITFNGFEVSDEYAIGTLDISANFTNNTETESYMRVYIYTTEISNADFNTGESDKYHFNQDDKTPYYPIQSLTPYSTFDNINNNVSGSFTFPLNTSFYLYLLTFYSDGNSNADSINQKYVNFRLLGPGTPVIGPTLTAISPLSGLTTGGANFTLNGSNLSDVTTVKFGSISVSSIEKTATTITGTTPSQSSAGSQIIYLDDVNSNFSFNYYLPPTLTSITPFGGLNTGGANFTLVGTNLSNVTAVKFGSNSVSAITKTATTITGKTPIQDSAGLQLIYLDDVTYNDISFNYYTNFNTLITDALEKIEYPLTYEDSRTATEATSISNTSSSNTSVYNTFELPNNINDYFSLLSNYDTDNSTFIAERKNMVDKLFEKTNNKYPLTTPINTIVIDSADFPFSPTERSQGMTANTKYKLIDYTNQKYSVVNFTYQNKDDEDTVLNFLNYMNNENLSSYITIPTSDKSEFTYVFNNVLVGKFIAIEECTFCCDDSTSAELGTAIYAKIDVRNPSGTPSYRVRIFSAFQAKLNVTFLNSSMNNEFFIITSVGENTNWKDIDKSNKYSTSGEYKLYDIIEYNGTLTPGIATGEVHKTTLQKNSDYRSAQEKISLSLSTKATRPDISTKQNLDINFNFIMGSLIFGTLNASITDIDDIFDEKKLGGGFSGISPKPIVLVERGNERNMSRIILRRAGYQEINSFIAQNPGYNSTYIIQGGQAVKNKTFLKQDSSDRTARLKLKAINKTYNDLSFGGDDNNGSYTSKSKTRY
jgi:hypothetical protein